MTLDEFFKELKSKIMVEPYIVTLKYKYDFEDEYTIRNEILEVDNYGYIWENDWNEGQTDVEVLGYIPVSEVNTAKGYWISGMHETCSACGTEFLDDILNITYKWEYPKFCPMCGTPMQRGKV